MKFYGELLVFALLFITNLRVFFVHHVRRDPLVVLAPFTFIVAILQIFAWGIDAFTVLGLLIALFVLLSSHNSAYPPIMSEKSSSLDAAASVIAFFARKRIIS